MGNFLSPLLLSIHVNVNAIDIVYNSCSELSTEEYQPKEFFLYTGYKKAKKGPDMNVM